MSECITRHQHIAPESRCHSPASSSPTRRRLSRAIIIMDRGPTAKFFQLNAEEYNKQDGIMHHARKKPKSTTSQRINTVKALQQKPCSISSHHGKHYKNSKIAIWRGQMSGEKAAASDDVGGGSFVRLCATNTTTCLLRFPQRRLSRPHLILLKL